MIRTGSFRMPTPAAGPRFAGKPVDVPHTGTETPPYEKFPEAGSPLDPVLQAVANGADAVELDIRLIREEDGGKRLGVTAAKTLNGRPAQTYLGHRMASLDEIIAALPDDVTLFLEAKTGKAYFPNARKTFERKIADFVKTNNLYDRVVIVSFSYWTLRRIEKLDPKIKTGFRFYNPRYHGARQDLMDLAHRKGGMSLPWVAGQNRAGEKKLYDDLIAKGADAIVTNAPEKLNEHLADEKRSKPEDVRFGGSRGKNDLQNLLPDFYLKHWVHRRDYKKHWRGAKERFERLSARLEKKAGFSEADIEEMHALTLKAIGFPAGFRLDMSDKAFGAFYKSSDKAGRARINYGLERFGVFSIDGMGMVFSAITDRGQWPMVHWFLTGLLDHPDNQHPMLGGQPMGKAVKPLSHALETNSPYWQMLTQLTRHYEELLDDAFFSPDTRLLQEAGSGWETVDNQAPDFRRREAAYRLEKTRFAKNVLYELIVHAPAHDHVDERVARFVERQFPEILKSFQKNYPAPKGIAVNKDGQVIGGHPDYFETLQRRIWQNAVRLVLKTEAATRAPRDIKAPFGDPAPLNTLHGPLNHLIRQQPAEEDVS